MQLQLLKRLSTLSSARLVKNMPSQPRKVKLRPTTDPRVARRTKLPTPLRSFPLNSLKPLQKPAVNASWLSLLSPTSTFRSEPTSNKQFSVWLSKSSNAKSARADPLPKRARASSSQNFTFSCSKSSRIASNAPFQFSTAKPCPQTLLPNLKASRKALKAKSKSASRSLRLRRLPGWLLSSTSWTTLPTPRRSESTSSHTARKTPTSGTTMRCSAYAATSS